MDPEQDRSIRLLRERTMFRELSSEALAELVAGTAERTLAAGEPLFAQGDAGDAMYLLTEGALEVRVRHASGRHTTVDRLAAGAVVGEMALLTDQPRNATVAAIEPSRLLRLAREDFERAAAAYPQLLEVAHRSMRPRLQRAQTASMLRDWFGVRDADEVLALQQAVTWTAVPRGAALFRRGDAAASVYLVVSGRFRLRSAGEEAGADGRTEVGRGESLGGAALLLGDAHRADAEAIRDSHVIEVPGALAEATPGFLHRLARDVIGRSAGGRSRTRGKTTSIVLLPLDGDAPAREVGDAVLQELRDFTTATLVSAAQVDARFGREGVSASRPGDPFDPALASWVDEQERTHAQVLYLAQPSLGPWTERCLAAADVVVLVASSDSPTAARSWEAALAERLPGVPRELVLVHDDACTLPSGTRAWLEPRDLRAHHHMRLGVPGDVARVTRRLAGRGLALALSGGGARGYVHIGLLRAAAEAGLPVDAVAGSSMGALVGGVFALTGDHEPCMDTAAAFGDPRKVIDYTLPMVALTRSRKVTALMRQIFAEVQIEDLWIPFVCVSASLTRSEPRLHERGSLWRAVRASAAIPGVFTPILMDGEVLVDGGVMDNFPVDVARRRLDRGVILGSNAYGSETRGRPLTFGDEVDGWGLALARLLPKRLRRTRAPSMLGTLMRSTSLSSHFLMEEAGRRADLVVRYPTEGISSLEFGRYPELIALGYEHGRRALEGWDPWGEEPDGG